MKSTEISKIVQRGNNLEVKLYLSYDENKKFSTKTSPEFVIKRSGVFQIKIEISSEVRNTCTQIPVVESCRFNVRFFKRRREDELNYIFTFTSKELIVADKRFTSDDGSWHALYCCNGGLSCVNISVRMDVLPCSNSFASLHDDTELTDFELRGTDGAVPVHRAVLAAASPVLRRMLSGAWLEKTEGYVDIPDTTSATLQHFKNYLYLHTLPESGLEQLLLLSSYYMMPDLIEKCVDKLIENVSAVNVWDVIEFATKHKVARLLLCILECVNSGVISVTDMDAK